MRLSKAFTLIEFLFVIVILGIIVITSTITSVISIEENTIKQDIRPLPTPPVTSSSTEWN